MQRVTRRVNSHHVIGAAILIGLALLLVLVMSTVAQASFRLDYTDGVEPQDGIAVARVTAQADDIAYKGRSASVSVIPAPRTTQTVSKPVQGTPAAGSVQELGRAMAAKHGWIGGEWDALRQLWIEESGWKTTARNPSSGACGIPQRHPCNGLTSDAAGQIAWGLDYIAGRYGRPSAALGHKHSRGWY